MRVNAWWIRRQINDTFVHKAIQQDYRSRSAFKLLEIQQKYNVIRPGDAVLDCGAAPGGWSEVARNQFGDFGRDSMLISVDIKRFDEISGAISLYPLNLNSPISIERIREVLTAGGHRYLDVILSDMAPNMTGQSDADHTNSIILCKSVMRLAGELLGAQGKILMKVMQGGQLRDFQAELQRHFFKPIRVIKPEASRKVSREIYLLGVGYKKNRLK